MAFKEVFESGAVKREDLFITSKLWNTDHGRVRAACQKTLADLQLKYLDLYLVHWPISMAPGVWEDGEFFDANGNLRLEMGIDLKQVWKEMEKLVADGLVKNIGLSNCNVQRINELLPHCSIMPAALQVELHPYLPQNEVVKFCHDKGIAVTAYSPFGSGREPKLMQDAVIGDIAQRLNKTPAQVLLAWAIQRGTSVIPKSVNSQRIQQNFDVDFVIPESDMEKIADIKIHHRYVSPAKFWKHPLFEDETIEK
jgi:alcohol dehydrogenase (NADP+)